MRDLMTWVITARQMQISERVWNIEVLLFSTNPLRDFDASIKIFISAVVFFYNYYSKVIVYKLWLRLNKDFRWIQVVEYWILNSTSTDGMTGGYLLLNMSGFKFIWSDKDLCTFHWWWDKFWSYWVSFRGF